MRELAERYLHGHIRVVKSDKFVLDGVLLEVSDDCILLESRGRERVIKFNAILELYPLGDD